MEEEEEDAAALLPLPMAEDGAAEDPPPVELPVEEGGAEVPLPALDGAGVPLEGGNVLVPAVAEELPGDRDEGALEESTPVEEGAGPEVDPNDEETRLLEAPTLAEDDDVVDPPPLDAPPATQNPALHSSAAPQSSCVLQMRRQVPWSSASSCPHVPARSHPQSQTATPRSTSTFGKCVATAEQRGMARLGGQCRRCVSGLPTASPHGEAPTPVHACETRPGRCNTRGVFDSARI